MLAPIVYILITVTDKKEIKGGKPKIDIGFIKHIEAMLKKKTPYDIKELPAETKGLM